MGPKAAENNLIIGWIMMRNLVAACCLLVSASLIIPCLAYSQDKTEGPILAMEEREFDFGKVKEGSRVSHEFRVMNEGDSVLEIEKVQPG